MHTQKTLIILKVLIAVIAAIAAIHPDHIHEYAQLLVRVLGRCKVSKPPADKPELGECWVWTGPRLKSGYGRLTYVNSLKIGYTHRLMAWIFHRLPLCNKTHEVHHKCNNKPCCRPSHLVVVTSKENKMAAVEDGRIRSGAQAVGAKLTDKQVRAFRKRYRKGTSIKQLLRETRVRRTTLYKALVGITYNSLPGAVTDIPPRRDWRGERHGKAKLRKAQIKRIYKLYWTRRATTVELGKRYGVSDETIRAVVQNTSWKHVRRPLIPGSPTPPKIMRVKKYSPR